jgi:uncharacterized membrane protein SpoIIM required for sporulation
VDIDRFLAENGPAWTRLDHLSRRAGPGARRLDAAELFELITLYQRTSTNLSYATSTFDAPGLSARLSQLVAQAGSIIYGTRPRTLRGFSRFFTDTLPAALWHVRWLLLVSATLLFVPAIGFGVWLDHSPRAVDATAPAALRAALINHDFTAYYRSAPSAEFAVHVYTNNVQVAIEAFAGGILIIPTVLVLMFNGANVGIDGGLFAAAHQSGKFWGSVTPHGLIELTSVVIAGAAGLALGWAAVSPRDRTRREALAEDGRRAVTLIFGTVFTLAIAGTIEGFVTGSALPTWARVGIGVVVELAFLVYAVACGRRAARLGLTGALGEATSRWTASGRGDLARVGSVGPASPQEQADGEGLTAVPSL